jgi:peptidoglycan/LPS O-acetylase OafA/YrhL
VVFLGVPDSSTRFYPTILGAVLIGIAVALLIEYVRRPSRPAGLGLHGAIAINLCGALFLIGWLLCGGLEIPLRGQVFLWSLAALLIVISLVELIRSRGLNR